MRKYWSEILLAFVLLAVALNILPIKAQTTAPWQVGVGTSTHTACTVVPASTQYCFAFDGLWVSLNGAAYVQVQTGTVTAGVTSITINGGTPQTGPVALTIPTKASSTTTTTIQ